MRKKSLYVVGSVLLIFAIYGYIAPIIGALLNPVTVCCPAHTQFPGTDVDVDKDGTEYEFEWTSDYDRSVSYLTEKLTLKTDLTTQKIVIKNQRGEDVVTLNEVGDRETVKSKELFTQKDGQVVVITHKEYSDYTENYGVVRQGSSSINVGNIEGVEYYPLKGLSFGSP